MSVGNALQTLVESYNLVFTGESKGATTSPVAFPKGITSGDIDLLLPQWGGKGTETKGNLLLFLFLGDADGAATIEITGACEGGPEEYICSLDLTFGGTVESGTDVWCEAIALTSYHIGACSILVADSGHNHPTKFGFDAMGYRYIRFYSNTYGGNTHTVWVYARYF